MQVFLQIMPPFLRQYFPVLWFYGDFGAVFDEGINFFDFVVGYCYAAGSPITYFVPIFEQPCRSFVRKAVNHNVTAGGIAVFLGFGATR